MARPPADPADLAARLLRGERPALAQAITLVESRREDDRPRAQELLRAILPHAGRSRRIGVSGAPGSGKSTFIEALGVRRADAGQRVAVLSIDPSSVLSGGSLLGDKSRMTRLSHHERAFVRPSPNSTTLGGVAARTREAVLLCEAAGHDLIFVETVGVGQSEVQVMDLVDCSLVLLVAGGGDELQGIKRGIMERADLLVVHKADGERREASLACRAEFANALMHLRSPRRSWTPEVLCASSVDGSGLDEVWERMEAQATALRESGEGERAREEQRSHWWTERCEERLLRRLREADGLTELRRQLDEEVRQLRMLPDEAADRLLSRFMGLPPTPGG